MAGAKAHKKKKKTGPSKGPGQPASEAGPTGSPAVAPSAAAVAPPTAATAPNGGSGLKGGAAATAAARPKLDPSALLKRATLLREEGNKQFQAKRFEDALHTYEVALKFCPEAHPDRAVLHSNRAACYLQMKPVRYELVIMECTLALTLRPKFSRALLRRAKGYEGLGRVGAAEEDLKLLLQEEPDNEDAKELLRKLNEPKEVEAMPKEAPAAIGIRGPVLPPKPTPRADGVGPVGGQGLGSEVEEGPDGEQEGQQQVLLDDWYVELANLIRHRLGIDPMAADPLDVYAADFLRAMEDTVSSEEATPMLEAAEAKFASATTMMLTNWANVHRVLSQRKSLKKKKTKATGEKEEPKPAEEVTEESAPEDKGAPVETGAVITVAESEEKAPSEEEVEGGEKEPITGEHAGEGEEKDGVKEEAPVEGEEEEATETAEEELERQLRDCDWSLNHLAIALEKYEQALQIQPNMSDSMAATAFCLADRARTTARKAELLAQGPQKVPLTPALALQVHDDFRSAMERFNKTKLILDQLEEEVLARPDPGCTYPEHSHGHGHGPEANGDGADHTAVHFLDKLRRYRCFIGNWWLSALGSAAEYEHKLGTDQWKHDLQEAVKLIGIIDEKEKQDDTIAMFFSSLAAPLNTTTVESLMGEGGEEDALVGDVPGGGETSPWAAVWAQREGTKTEEEMAVSAEAGAEKGVELAANEGTADVESGKKELPMEEEKEKESASSATPEGTTTPEANAGADAAPAAEGEKKEDPIANFWENLFKKKDKDKRKDKDKETQEASKNAQGAKEAVPSTLKKQEEVKKEDAAEGAGGQGKEKAGAIKGPKLAHLAVAKNRTVGSFEGDEPMTPVKDLVGKFTSLSKNM